MKKILIALAFSLMCVVVSVSAATVNLENAGGDIINVGGAANEGETVSVMVLNPGYDEEDILLNPTKAIQFYGDTKGNSDKTFSLSINMKNLNSGSEEDEGGGKFTLLVSKKDSSTPEKSTFDFYFADKKLEVIDKLNNPANQISDLIEEAYTIYSLSGTDIFKATSKSSIATNLEKMRSFENDVDVMFKALKKALAISAFNEGVSPLVVSGVLQYTDVIGVEGSYLHSDYIDALSSGGKSAVNTGIMKKNYKNVEEIAAEFNNLVLINVITNYGKEMGYGHVPEYFEKYEVEYEAAGFAFEKLGDITNKNGVYMALENANVGTLTALIEVYEEALLTADTPPATEDTFRPGTGVGSVGGGSPSGGGGGKVPSSGAAEREELIVNPDAIVLPFNDLQTVSWAKEAIAALYKMGVIAGKNESSFAPNDLVTREEFTKMVVVAFFGEPISKECEFSDVRGWSSSYVQYAFDNNIVSGIGDSVFEPGGNITREAAVAVVMRSLKAKGYEGGKTDDKFSDDSSISQWAKEDVSALVEAGIISGRDNNMFCPKDSMTRAEAAKVIYYSIELVGGAK
jgi:hypothetical protein